MLGFSLSYRIFFHGSIFADLHPLYLYSSLYPSSHPFHIVVVINHFLLCAIPGGLALSLFPHQFISSAHYSTPRASSAQDDFAHSSASSPASISIGFVSPPRVWVPNPQNCHRQPDIENMQPSSYGKRNLISVVFVCYWPDPRRGSPNVLCTSSPSAPASIHVYLPRVYVL